MQHKRLFLIVTNAFKLLPKLPHEVWTSSIKYILLIRELYSLTLSITRNLKSVCYLNKFVESTHHLLDDSKMSLMFGLEDFYPNIWTLWVLLISYFILVLISQTHHGEVPSILQVTFNHFQSLPSPGYKGLQSKKKRKRRKERKGKYKWKGYKCILQWNQDRNRENHVWYYFSFMKKKKWHMNILLRSPLFFSFSFLFSGSHLPSLSHPPFFRLDISSFVLSSIHFSCSLVYFMSNLFAAIQRASALLRHYPEIPKLLQTLSAPELKNYRHFSAGVHLE